MIRRTLEPNESVTWINVLSSTAILYGSSGINVDKKLALIPIETENTVFRVGSFVRIIGLAKSKKVKV